MDSTKFCFGEPHISGLPRVLISEWEVNPPSKASNRGTFTGAASPTVGNHKTWKRIFGHFLIADAHVFHPQN